MRIMQKTVIYLSIIPLILSFSSCVRDKRFDYSEMNVRIRAEAPEFAFDESGLFYSDGVYYCCYSLCDEDDMLLTLKEDEKKKLDRVTLTLDVQKAGTSEESFRRFSLLLARIFIPEFDEEALISATGISDVSLTSDVMNSYCAGFYKAVLFCSGEAACFMLLYG